MKDFRPNPNDIWNDVTKFTFTETIIPVKSSTYPDRNHKAINRLLLDICHGESSNYPLDLYYVTELLSTLYYCIRALIKRKKELKKQASIKLYKLVIDKIDEYKAKGLSLEESMNKFNKEVMILFSDIHYLKLFLKRAKQKLANPDLTFREIQKQKKENK